jgi:hypothetical protein
MGFKFISTILKLKWDVNLKTGEVYSDFFHDSCENLC